MLNANIHMLRHTSMRLQNKQPRLATVTSQLLHYSQLRHDITLTYNRHSNDAFRKSFHLISHRRSQQPIVFAPNQTAAAGLVTSSLILSSTNLKQTISSSSSSSSLLRQRFPSDALQQQQQQQQQRRSLSTVADHIWDVFRTGQIFPPNPILNTIHSIKNTTTATNDNLPTTTIDFTLIEPRHITPALDQIVTTIESSLSTFESRLLSSSSSNLSYDEVMNQWYDCLFPLLTLHNITHQLYTSKKTSEWKESNHAVTHAWNHFSSWYPDCLDVTLRRLQKELLTATATDDDDVAVERYHALTKIIQRHDQQEQQQEQDSTTTTTTRLIEIDDELSSLETTFKNTLDEHSTQPHILVRVTLPLMYDILRLKRDAAIMEGNNHHYDGLLRSRMATLDRIRELNDVMGMRLAKALPEGPLRSSPPTTTTAAAADVVEDMKSHLELNTVLNGLFQIIEKYFGIVITPSSTDPLGYHRDTRLYHAYDTNTNNDNDDNTHLLLGSFYLDPFKRQLKEPSSYVRSLVDRSPTQKTVLLSLNCQITPPLWDDEGETLCSVEDVRVLFHEMGHVLELLVSDVEFGFWSGVQAKEVDRSEFMSLLMECFFYDPHTLALLTQKNNNNSTLPPPPSPLLLSSLQKIMKFENLQNLSYELFLSQLELALNVDFDPHSGTDSIVSLQKQMMLTYMKESPPKGDLSHLIKVFEMGWEMEGIYRYLWSRMMAVDAFEFLMSSAAAEGDDDGSSSSSSSQEGRKMIKLLLGGQCGNAEEAFVKWRGRGVSLDPLMRWYGLEEEKKEEEEGNDKVEGEEKGHVKSDDKSQT